MQDTGGDAWYEVCNQAGSGGGSRAQCLLDEAEVMAEFTADVVEEGATMDRLCSHASVEGSLGISIM